MALKVVIGRRQVAIASAVIVGLLLLLLLFLLRYPFLRLFSDFLIYEDGLQQAEVLFVLSGGAYDRGNEAVRLYEAGYVPRIICTGANMYESEITRAHILNSGVPAGAVELFIRGTSTFEEADFIRSYCAERGIRKCMIVSTKFHTRRIKRVFDQRFTGSSTELIIRGAPASSYDENHWWANEYGLINLNNEYIKLGYYWVRY